MATTPHETVRIGARKSALAQAQADLVAAELHRQGVESTTVPISTHGDVDQRQLTQIGGTGVFVGAVREALLEDRIDVAVHSLKDLPTAPADDLEIIAYPARDDTRDVLVGRRLADLRAGVGVRIGTGAPRRVAQLEQLNRDRAADLRIEPVRGNVETRMGLVRSGQFDAVVLAAAGLRRLGLLDIDAGTAAGLPAELLPHELMLPAPGQGVLAVETVSSLDSEIRAVLTRLDDSVTRTEALAERQFLAVLGAGCTAPVGARALAESNGIPGTDLTLHAVIGKTRGGGEVQQSPDTADGGRSWLGSRPNDLRTTGDATSEFGPINVQEETEVIWLRGRGTATDPQDLGSRAAADALAVAGPHGFTR